MKRHPNARVAPRGREALASRVRAGERVSDAARQMGAGRQTASKRLARDRLGEGAADRSRRSGGMGARGRARRGGPKPSPPSSTAAIGTARAARAGASHVAHRRRQQPIGTQQLVVHARRSARAPHERGERRPPRVRRAPGAAEAGEDARPPRVRGVRQGLERRAGFQEDGAQPVLVPRGARHHVVALRGERPRGLEAPSRSGTGSSASGGPMAVLAITRASRSSVLASPANILEAWCAAMPGR